MAEMLFIRLRSFFIPFYRRKSGSWLVQNVEFLFME